MKTFNDLYEAVFTAPSKEEKAKNNIEYHLKYVLDKSKLVKRPDSMYDYNDDLDISNINITKFSNFPYQCHTINGKFSISNTNLESLKGCPEIIKLSFNCSINKLTTLEHGPQKIGDSYNCDYNKLITLKGCPEIINGDFTCNNNNLKTLEYCPKIIHGSFVCHSNKLETLDYFPKEVHKMVFCQMVKSKEYTVAQIKSRCKVSGKILINYY